MMMMMMMTDYYSPPCLCVYLLVLWNPTNSTYCPNHRTTPPSGSTSASGEYISLAKDGIKVDLGARRPWKPMFDYRSLNFAHSFVTYATTPSLSSSSPQSSPSSSASDQINPYTASDQINQTSENSIKLIPLTLSLMRTSRVRFF
ncbi:hypothetical protein ACLB2K_048544 [Fragaria x ananassa]